MVSRSERDSRHIHSATRFLIPSCTRVTGLSGLVKSVATAYKMFPSGSTMDVLQGLSCSNRSEMAGSPDMGS